MHASIYIFLAPTLLHLTRAQNPKRGIAYLGDTHKSDNSLLLRDVSPLSWYYTWSLYPATAQIPASELEFTPLIHGIDGAEDSATKNALNGLPASSQHLLTFNEPDGTTDSGGSSISPEDAAKAYIEHIAPYRSGNSRNWNISHPSVTGSPRGLEWLQDFNTSCYEIDEKNGCPTDFIAAHWYGAFDGLKGWLSSLDDFYNGNRSDDEPKLKIWVTEMALPKADAEATVGMMNETLPYLDGLDYVERYAWFGAFRANDANEWTGDGVALFGDDGALTDLGALYLNGKKGEKGQGEEGAASGLHANCGLVLSLLVGAVLVNYW
ncbi:glycoside hydrolase family 128 protein [Melanomma pulvis-pyrius CBS 109.77]|uniref:Glycoside hydrolase family 128 protein n=1 Tax=Melanomma pulvis-pyrius CBS 109.77 TaxID=1314802 RepID=A0A6A6WZB8_9PLEO|nr:glycoside hydrolase family 128 protein [Melanomma pulvis-pyrius CBS 109.77]